MTAATATLNDHQWAVAVDTVLGGFWQAQQTAQDRLAGAFEGVHYALDERATYRSKFNKSWPTSGPEAVELLVAKVASNAFEKTPWKRQEAERALVRVTALREEQARLQDATEEFEAEWEELRWSRFFLVTNNNGHIHRTRSCSTCFPSTLFAWLPTLSGLTEAEAVAEHGTIFCSVCFPSAPVEWTVGKQPDSNTCPGTRDFDAPSRTGFYSGNWATCKDCGERAALTSTGKLRKHKKAV